MDDYNRKIGNELLLFTARQYLYGDWPPMTVSASEHLATESHNKLMPPTTRPFNVIGVSLATAAIYEEGIPNTVYMERATLAPSASFQERQLVYTPEEPSEKRKDKVDEGAGQIIVEGIAEAPGEFAVACIVRHVGEGDIV